MGQGVRGLRRDHRGIAPEVGDQIEAERLPLAYLAYDDKDDVFIVAASGGNGQSPELRHMVDHPQRVLADPVRPDVPCALEVIGADRGQTIVTLQRPRP